MFLHTLIFEAPTLFATRPAHFWSLLRTTWVQRGKDVEKEETITSRINCLSRSWPCTRGSSFRLTYRRDYDVSKGERPDDGPLADRLTLLYAGMVAQSLLCAQRGVSSRPEKGLTFLRKSCSENKTLPTNVWWPPRSSHAGKPAKASGNPTGRKPWQAKAARKELLWDTRKTDRSDCAPNRDLDAPD